MIRLEGITFVYYYKYHLEILYGVESKFISQIYKMLYLQNIFKNLLSAKAFQSVFLGV